MKTLIFLGILSVISIARAETPFTSENTSVPTITLKEAQRNSFSFSNQVTLANQGKIKNLKATKMIRGGQDGNGGDAVVRGRRVSLLDLMEPGDKILSLKQEPYIETVEQKMDFFVYQTGLPPSTRELTWVLTSQDLDDIQDEGVIRYQGPGELKQLAIQKDDVIVINEKLFLKLKEQGKAALIVHEMVISALLEAGYDLSSPVGKGPIRQIVNLLFTENYMDATPGFYKKILNQLPLSEDSATVQGFNIATPTHAFSINNRYNFRQNFKISNPRILVGNKYFKISAHSLGSLFICPQFGFKMPNSGGDMETAPSLMDEVAIRVNDHGTRGRTQVLLKKDEHYVKEIICSF